MCNPLSHASAVLLLSLSELDDVDEDDELDDEEPGNVDLGKVGGSAHELSSPSSTGGL